MIGEGVLAFERAEILDGGVHGIIPTNLALAYLEADRIDEALAAAKRAVAISPEVPSWMTLAMVSATAGHPEDAVPLYNLILDKEPKHPSAGMNCCFVQTLTEATPADLLKQRQRWYNANRYEGKIEPHHNDKTTDRPLRVGYVSGDFKSHSASFIFRRVLWHHTDAVAPYFYSTLPVDPEKDGATKRFKEVAGGRWRDISTLSDEDADKLIRQDKIDILIDLAAHTNGGRLALFTRKPAPVQVTAWGFAHGTGLPEIDYFFADPVAVPQEERVHYAEKVWDLPCIVTFEEPTEYNLKTTSIAPYRRNGYFTFGSFCRFEKLSDQYLTACAEIMCRVPDAKMMWKDHSFKRPYSIRRVMGFMKDVAPERLLFSQATNHADHLLSYQACDVMLDPVPHGGGCVAIECILLGVPLLTKYGTQPSGRTGASVLTAMGRTDWVAKTWEEYVDMAVDMAENPKLVMEARKTLHDELINSPVVKDYVHHVEISYKEMWRIYCAE